MMLVRASDSPSLLEPLRLLRVYQGALPGQELGFTALHQALRHPLIRTKRRLATPLTAPHKQDGRIRGLAHKLRLTGLIDDKAAPSIQDIEAPQALPDKQPPTPRVGSVEGFFAQQDIVQEPHAESRVRQLDLQVRNRARRVALEALDHVETSRARRRPERRAQPAPRGPGPQEHVPGRGRRGPRQPPERQRGVAVERQHPVAGALGGREAGGRVEEAGELALQKRVDGDDDDDRRYLRFGARAAGRHFGGGGGGGMVGIGSDIRRKRKRNRRRRRAAQHGFANHVPKPSADALGKERGLEVGCAEEAQNQD